MELRKAIFGLVVAVAAVALAAQDASAFWGHGSWGSYGGSWGSCGSSGGSWGSGGSYGSCGSCGGLFHRWASCGSCGGSYGSSGSSGSCGSCGGSYGSSGSSGSCGSCGSCGGEGGVSYSTGYGGEVVSEYAQSSRFVPADIYAASNVAPPAKTKLTLHVPAEAKVTLAGVATKQAGQVREFSTDKLAAGQAWQNYTIHVEVVRDGKTVAKDKQITLTGGAQQELSFDFGGEQVAQL
jgi:uncharacterized protein (TIGR03000 family)